MGRLSSSILDEFKLWTKFWTLLDVCDCFWHCLNLLVKAINLHTISCQYFNETTSHKNAHNLGSVQLHYNIFKLHVTRETTAWKLSTFIVFPWSSPKTKHLMLLLSLPPSNIHSSCFSPSLSTGSIIWSICSWTPKGFSLNRYPDILGCFLMKRDIMNMKRGFRASTLIKYHNDIRQRFCVCDVFAVNVGWYVNVSLCSSLHEWIHLGVCVGWCACS